MFSVRLVALELDGHLVANLAKKLLTMDLNQVGITIKCRCGSPVAATMADVLFADRGRVKVGQRPIACPVCGAVYHNGEQLKYHLVWVGPAPVGH